MRSPDIPALSFVSTSKYEVRTPIHPITLKDILLRRSTSYESVQLTITSPPYSFSISFPTIIMLRNATHHHCLNLNPLTPPLRPPKLHLSPRPFQARHKSFITSNNPSLTTNTLLLNSTKKPTSKPATWAPKASFSSQPPQPQPSKPIPLSQDQYHRLADAYIDALVEQLEELAERNEEVDVEYSVRLPYTPIPVSTLFSTFPPVSLAPIRSRN